MRIVKVRSPTEFWYKLSSRCGYRYFKPARLHRKALENVVSLIFADRGAIGAYNISTHI